VFLVRGDSFVRTHGFMIWMKRESIKGAVAEAVAEAVAVAEAEVEIEHM